MVQLCIDFGQKSLGQQITCSICDMMYVRGQDEDEEAHQKYCKRKQNGIPFGKWKKEKILKSNSTDSTRILELSNETSIHRKKLQQIKLVLDEALGFIPEKTFFTNKRYFVYIKHHRVAACIVAESITYAHRMDSTSLNIVCSTERQKAFLGIRHLWVDPIFRRQNLATELLDTIRQVFVYGMPILKEHIAFSQPTQLGKSFAQKYVAPFQVLVYY